MWLISWWVVCNLRDRLVLLDASVQNCGGQRVIG